MFLRQKGQELDVIEEIRERRALKGQEKRP